MKSGFVPIVGRPNVGKSSLLNALVKKKVAIISNKPQTTRNAIRGILTLDTAQIVFIDTPGFHKPRTLLGEHLNRLVIRTLEEVDAILFMLDASQKFGRGDAFMAERLSYSNTPTLCVINKADLVTPPTLLNQIESARRMGNWLDVLTTSTVRGTGIDDVVSALVGLVPEGPLYYPPEAFADQPEALVVAELIREKILDLTHEEIPHSVAVSVEEMSRREDSDLIDIKASIYAERQSQKGILIGRGGKMLREIGSRARLEIEALFGSRVFLDLRVKIEPRWRRDEQLLQRFGY